MSDGLFDPENFARMVAHKMGTLSYRDAAKEAGVATATFSRVVNGKPPSVETYLRLKRWIEGPSS